MNHPRDRPTETHNIDAENRLLPALPKGWDQSEFHLVCSNCTITVSCEHISDGDRHEFVIESNESRAATPIEVAEAIVLRRNGFHVFPGHCRDCMFRTNHGDGCFAGDVRITIPPDGSGFCWRFERKSSDA